ncbi:Crp/Fnr family transcriptional regulator [Arthrobacter sp. H35-D1]|uniref:Crp/Fnr family transcriptional regulator n=1 Tax=Arthrobacter sp. H35-D1 TaxID=3046202 RepID=UPI0024BADB76|nr:Crp/Fnr family transcriptional regulator [Arthrobacter sp. H35-D1]MDJ0312738.1 Crp/Fnr family transcriptional regulator [Arthrobacter sp. H35-D1]
MEQHASHPGHAPLEVLVGRVPLFSQLDDVELKDISGRVKLRHHRRNEQLYGAGESNPHLMIIHSGHVKVYRISESGHEQLIRVLGEGDFLGDTSFISGAPADHFASTLDAADICTLHHDDLRDYLLRFPTVTYKMLETLSTRLENTERQVSIFAGEGAEHRVAGYLLELAGKQGTAVLHEAAAEHSTEEQGTATVVLPIAKKDVASFLGLTPETLSRKFAQFESAGWIRMQPRRTVELLDTPALQQL